MLTFVLSSVVMPLFSLEAPLQEPEVKSSPSYSVEKLLDSSGYLYSNAKGSVLVVEKGTGITTYDLLGRLISVQDPPTGAARILVNEDGRVRFQSTESDAWIRDVTTFGSLNWARVDEDSYVES